MQHRTAIIAVALVATATLSAQGIPMPAKQLEKFAPMLGAWEGEGVAISEPGGPEMPWKAKSKMSKTLNGFFIREETVVDFSPAIETPLVMTNIFGWDPEKKAYVHFGIENVGIATQKTVTFEGDKLVITDAGITAGQAFLERGIVQVKDDVYSFKVERGVGANPLFTHVEGTMKRSKTADASFGPKTDVAFIENFGGDRMAKLDFLVGERRLDGTMCPAPGAPEMTIGAHETVKMIYGGQAMVSHVLGDPIAGMKWEGLNFMAWNETKQCYDSCAISNMGEFQVAEARMVGDDMVFNSVYTQGGQTSVVRSVLEVEGGKPVRIYTDHMTGSHKTTRNFDAKLKPAQAKK